MIAIRVIRPFVIGKASPARMSFDVIVSLRLARLWPRLRIARWGDLHFLVRMESALVALERWKNARQEADD